MLSALRSGAFGTPVGSVARAVRCGGRRRKAERHCGLGYSVPAALPNAVRVQVHSAHRPFVCGRSGGDLTSLLGVYRKVGSIHALMMRVTNPVSQSL